PGLLEDSKDESTLIHRLTAAELRERIAHESVGKGMIPKLRACADAVEQGVPFAHIIDGRVHNSLLIELLTVHGVGTMIKKEASWCSICLRSAISLRKTCARSSKCRSRRRRACCRTKASRCISRNRARARAIRWRWRRPNLA